MLPLRKDHKRLSLETAKKFYGKVICGKWVVCMGAEYATLRKLTEFEKFNRLDNSPEIIPQRKLRLMRKLSMNKKRLKKRTQ